MRIGTDGAIKAFDLPNAASVPSDVAIGPDGAVWFLEYRANSIGRMVGDRLQEFPVGGRTVGLVRTCRRAGWGSLVRHAA